MPRLFLRPIAALAIMVMAGTLCGCVAYPAGYADSPGYYAPRAAVIIARPLIAGGYGGYTSDHRGDYRGAYRGGWHGR